MSATIKGKDDELAGVMNLTLAEVATRLVVEQNQVGASLSGYFASGVFPRVVLDPIGGPAATEYIQTVKLGPAYPLFDRLCPRNFGAVVESAQKTPGLTLRTALQYYTKSKLCYGCCTSIMQFIGGVIPALEQEFGITQLPVGEFRKGRTDEETNAMVITLKDLEYFELHYVPHQRHSFYIDTDRGADKHTVENYNGGDFANHTILQCKSTGIVLDLTLGQLTGVMKPAIFASWADYEAAFPGRILKKFRQSDEAMLSVGMVFQQIQTVSPDFCPPRFGGRVVHHLKTKTPFCAQCLGVSVDVDLKRCSACQQVFYCAKTCQALHWKEHKMICTGRAKTQAVSKE